MPTEGNQTVCIYAINLGLGRNVLLGCPVLPGMTGSPTGSFDNVWAVGGTVTVGGWAFDPDSAAPTAVHVYVDSTGYAYTADIERPDIASVYPAYGANHGFGISVPASGGTHNVCVYAINTAGLGANKLLGCKTINMLSGAPIGVVDNVWASPGKFTVSGWAFDPDTTASIPVHVYANANGIAGVADQPRPDVAAVYSGYGDKHGYSISVPASPGLNTVCAYGIEISGPGSNRGLSCRTVVGMSGSPVGVVDAVTASAGQVTVSGWTYDPDTASPNPVHVYVDGDGYGYQADGDRPDVGAVYPAYGAKHGYSVTVPASAGLHRVCAYGINIGYGDNVQLRCITVTVP
jgi:hypothetical protein